LQKASSFLILYLIT